MARRDRNETLKEPQGTKPRREPREKRAAKPKKHNTADGETRAGETGDKTGRAQQKRARGGLALEARELLAQRDVIVAHWRNTTLSPGAAVAALSNLTRQDEQGNLWRILPRETGAVLSKTGPDGTVEIVEIPKQRSRKAAAVTVVGFALLALGAIVAALYPATDGQEKEPGEGAAVVATSE